MGNMIRVRVTVRGTRPLFQHCFGPDAIPLEKEERTGVAGNDPEEWKRTCMVTESGELFIHNTYVFASVRDGAKHTGKKGSGLQAKVAATLQVEEPIILLGRRLPPDGPRHNLYDQPVYLDVRGVRNPSTKGRNVRYRLACSSGWECSFTLTWDKTIVSREVMRSVLNDASNLSGLGNGRSIGMGRFEVLAWEVLEDAEEAPAEGTVGRTEGAGVGTGRKKVRPVQEAAIANGSEH